MSRLIEKAKKLLSELESESIEWCAVLAKNETEFLNYKTQYANNEFKHCVIIKLYE